MPIQVVTDFDSLPAHAFDGADRGDKAEDTYVRLGLTFDGRVSVYVADFTDLAHGVALNEGRIFEWGLPTGITPASAKQMVASVRPLLERVHAGHAQPGMLDGDAHAAALDLDAAIERIIAEGGIQVVAIAEPDARAERGDASDTHTELRDRPPKGGW